MILLVCSSMRILFLILLSFRHLHSLKAQNSLSNETVPPIQKIVGGFSVTAGTYPAYTQIFAASGSYTSSSGFFCGGSLVSPEFILTAAHCVDGETASTIKFKIGALCYQSDNCGQSYETRNARQIFSHPQYNSNSMVNDFALVKMTSRSTIQPLAFDPGNVSPSYTQGKRNLYVTGFGTTSSGGSVSNQLLAVELAYVTQTSCSSSYPNQIFPSMMCAADPNQDSCQGDSGGPLMDADNNNIQVGVVSWGNGCALANYPGIYSRISNQVTWIRDTICNNHSLPKPDYCPASPTAQPTTFIQSKRPTRKPTPKPTVRKPTRKPTVRKPTRRPTAFVKSRKPSNRKPTRKPSNRKPTRRPTAFVKSRKPSNRKPTRKPSRKPTSRPTTTLVSLKIIVKTDNYGEETWFEVEDTNNNNAVVLYSYAYLADKTQYSFSAQVNRFHCYNVFMYDDACDGSCCLYGSGYYEVWWGGNKVLHSSFEGGCVEASTVGNC